MPPVEPANPISSNLATTAGLSNQPETPPAKTEESGEQEAAKNEGGLSVNSDLARLKSPLMQSPAVLLPALELKIGERRGENQREQVATRVEGQRIKRISDAYIREQTRAQKA